jgi:hypothetical protein
VDNTNDDDNITALVRPICFTFITKIDLLSFFVNNDYQLDIVVTNSGTNNVCILFGYGNGTVTNQTWYALSYDYRLNWIVFKDLNNDGREDIAVTASGIDNIAMLLDLC